MNQTFEMESDTLGLESRQFSKMMGEGSDDDMDELLEKMSKNQNMNDSGIIEKSITFNSNLSENMVKLVRTIEERIDRNRSGSEENHQTEKLPTSYDFDGDPSVIDVYPSVTDVYPSLTDVYPSLTNVYPSVTDVYQSVTHVYPSVTDVYPSVTDVYPSVTDVYPSVIDGDPSVIHKNSTVKLINDIEQGLTYLYEKGEKTIIPDEMIHNKISVKNRLGVKIEDPFKTFLCSECEKSFPTIGQLQQHLNDHSQRKKKNHINIGKTGLPSKAIDEIQPHLFDIQLCKDLPELSLSQKEPETKPSSKGNHIKSRLGEKVEEISNETYACIKCKENFPTVSQLQQHINDHLQELKKMERKIEEKLSRTSRNASTSINGNIKDTRHTKESDKKVICRHCKMRFFKLEDLLCHLRAEHRARKRSTHKFTHTIGSKSKEKNSTPRTKVAKKMGLSDEKYNDVSHKVINKKLGKSVEMKSHRNEIRTESPVSDSLQFTCDVCAGIFFTKYDLTRHKDTTYCRNKSASIGIVHNSRMKFICKFCPVNFSKFYDLKKHLKVAHGNYKGAMANPP